MFSLGCEERLVGVFAVGNGASKPGKLVEDDCRLCGIGKEQLAEDIGDKVGNAEDEEARHEEEKGGHDREGSWWYSRKRGI